MPPRTPTSTAVLDSLITPATLADRLGLTQRTLSEKRIRGTGPAYVRIGKSVRYRPESVDAWLLEQEYNSTSREVR
jgi:predicted DNA-binding transcriptional regulator AlpA